VQVGNGIGNFNKQDMEYFHKYPSPLLTVDCVLFGFDQEALKVLLIQRGKPPFLGGWAFPGGFVRINETVDDAARRELAEEAGVKDVYLEQLYTFGALKRDPRQRIVSVAYYALVKRADFPAQAATDATAARWFPVSEPPELAFDHAEILAAALARLRGKLRYQPIGFELLPPKFTLSQLQQLYETVLGVTLDKRNFRKKVLGFGFLVGLKETLMDGAHRPAQLYRFDEEKYERLRKRGFNFEL
jgi:8-oxo-dGTP diphosphatase